MGEIANINIGETLKKAKALLAKDKSLSPSARTMFELMVMIITLLCHRLNLNSKNSSIPPSKDPHRARKTRKDKGNQRTKLKPGAQPGHPGSTLEKADRPDKVEDISIDRRTIPTGNYRNVGYESRQVIDIKISTEVIEYRAEILESESGKQYVANFPKGVNNPVQYGNEVKSQSVDLSQNQLIPLERTKEHFNNQLGLPISKGSIVNFNIEAFNKLENFEKWTREHLINSKLLHGDETGINVNGKLHWLHCLSNNKLALYHIDEKRGKDAMDRMEILPNYHGILCHDHWKPYYKYGFTHSLCNAHHLRELERAWEEDEQKWAKSMQKLLCTINDAVDKAGGRLSAKDSAKYEKRYNNILERGIKECPLPPPKSGERGRRKKSRPRNLLDRLSDYKDDALRFMTVKIVPFTNNQGENDIRMTKVQQKISGCFRSFKGAQRFCRIRSYILTCKKNGVNSTDALRLLFAGESPEFMK